MINISKNINNRSWHKPKIKVLSISKTMQGDVSGGTEAAFSYNFS